MRSSVRGGTALLMLISVCAFTPAAEPRPTDEKAVRAILDREMKGDFENKTVKDLCLWIGEQYGLAVRVDGAALKRLGSGAGLAVQVKEGAAEAKLDLNPFYDARVEFVITRGVKVSDALTEMATAMPGRWAWRIRDNSICFVPAFIPPVMPGVNANSGGDVAPHMIHSGLLAEQLLGESVNFQVKKIPLEKALEVLRKRTGANIVLDRKVLENAKTEVTASFHDARLLTVLQTLADMAELKVASVNNVFYVTSAENADRMQAEHNRDLYGEPNRPAGFGGFCKVKR